MDIFRQLGNLCLQAIPTVIAVLFFYVFLRWAFFNPIDKVMDERKARIEGARAEAAKAQASAEHELEAYNEALKKARAEIWAEQEAARQGALDERARLLKAMRNRSQETVEQSKRRIALELEAARVEIGRQVPQLAAEVARGFIAKPVSVLEDVQ
jgi:F-type H+-transporting ATPase subunit b